MNLSPTSKRNALDWLASVVYWGLIAGLFLFIRFYGTGEKIDWAQSYLGYILLSIIAGSIAGSLYWLASIIIDNSSLRKKSYGFLLLAKGLSIAISLSLLVFISRLIALQKGLIPIDQLLQSYFDRMSSSLLLVAFTYVALAGALLSLLKQFTTMVGTRVFFNLLRGKYYHPKVEDRIFMFLDLRSSTTYAERLGHIKYSRLIQDCFYDLTDSAIQHEVEIYQYIGDEAVLTWKIETGFRNSNCLKVYFAFKNTIESRKDHYKDTYGFVPEFKAGVNVGSVTVAQVGVLRREIAYHSEVLNIAARIQGQCNVLEEDLLVSKRIEELSNSTQYKFNSKGKISLRGKSTQIELFSVNH